MVNNEARKRMYSNNSLLGILILLYASSSFLNIYSNWVYFIPSSPLNDLISPYWDILPNISLLIANLFLLVISIKILNINDIRNINREWISLFLLFFLSSKLIYLLRGIWIDTNLFNLNIFTLRRLIYVYQILLGIVFLSRLITKNKIINKNILVLISIYLIIYSVSIGQAMISIFENEGVFSFNLFVSGVQAGIYFIASVLTAFIVMHKTLRPDFDMKQWAITILVKTIFIFVSLYYLLPLVYFIFIGPEFLLHVGNYSVVFLSNAAIQFIFGFIIFIYPNKIKQLHSFL